MNVNDTPQQRLVARRSEYERLKANPAYTNVKFDERTGGLMATHINHNFDLKKGWYEKEVQRIGYENGISVILGKEGTEIARTRYVEGTWNEKRFEIAGKETATPSNIKKGLNHCAGKPDTEIAVLYFPNNNFDVRNFERGLAMYNGIEKSGGQGFRKFKEIICIQGNNIVYKKSHQ